MHVAIRIAAATLFHAGRVSWHGRWWVPLTRANVSRGTFSPLCPHKKDLREGIVNFSLPSPVATPVRGEVSQCGNDNGKARQRQDGFISCFAPNHARAHEKNYESIVLGSKQPAFF